MARTNRVYRNSTPDTPDHTDFDKEIQQAARDAVMEIPLFPDLDRELIKALGFGPHCKMLQHYVYWMHPRHPKMQNRWSIWKTFDEWRDECGLTDRQVKRGRKILSEKGIMTHKRGQYSKVFYEVDWVALAEVLGIDSIPDGNSVQYEDLDDLEDGEIGDFIPDGIASDFIPDGITVPFIPDGITVRLNTEDYAGDYLTGDSLLQSGGEPAKAEPPPQGIDGKKEEVSHNTPPVGDKRISQNGHARSETAAGQEVDAEPVVEITPPKPDDDALLDEIRAVLDPDTGWCYAGLVRAKRGYWTDERIADSLAKDEELPAYNGRARELEPFVRYVFWEEGAY